MDRLSWAEHIALMGVRRGAYRFLVGKLERKRPLGRPTCRSEDNIKFNLPELMGVGGGMEWFGPS